MFSQRDNLDSMMDVECRIENSNKVTSNVLMMMGMMEDFDLGFIFGWGWIGLRTSNAWSKDDGSNNA